jgi:transcriptional regulator with XRE-family HTH domain
VKLLHIYILYPILYIFFINKYYNRISWAGKSEMKELTRFRYKYSDKNHPATTLVTHITSYSYTCNVNYYYICNMKDQLLKLLKHLGLTATRFADEIGVQRSGISHIISGRNQPSYDFIVKIMHRYPEISLDWLILGKGPLLKAGKTEPGTKPDLFTPVENPAIPNSSQEKVFTGAFTAAGKESKVTYVNSIDQIVIFYSDGSFKPYLPSTSG